MTDERRPERHSHALEPELIKDSTARAEAEARNGLRQYDFAVQTILQALERGAFKLRISLILSLQREALQGISAYAGNFRPGDVEIKNSKHEPVGAHLVPELVEDMCDYVNGRWDEDRIALHLAAYVMWRLNWIHPFADGNGRTSRILAFTVLCNRIGFVLPGVPTFPDLIVDRRSEYEDALDAADAAWKETGAVDVSMMESFLESLVAKQLGDVFEMAGGRV
ncbi:cell filamentation protein Fic [Aureimonas ureilytica]|uniref:Cell filamentation protein Fic n=1 Tax=Aureimonas ureilytica TaxID=401562 RepID=A0A175RDT4_9HYPH|nr:Fic family protein [Aureimonas ureilytica]KTQ97555.1 cell filamentation protein Fic [Aureimonas ureilytica]